MVYIATHRLMYMDVDRQECVQSHYGMSRLQERARSRLSVALCLLSDLRKPTYITPILPYISWPVPGYNPKGPELFLYLVESTSTHTLVMFQQSLYPLAHHDTTHNHSFLSLTSTKAHTAHSTTPPNPFRIYCTLESGT
jgi:hypothetical protein